MEKDGEGNTSTVATSSGMERRARAISLGRALPRPLSNEEWDSLSFVLERWWLYVLAVATVTLFFFATNSSLRAHRRPHHVL